MSSSSGSRHGNGASSLPMAPSAPVRDPRSAAPRFAPPPLPSSASSASSTTSATSAPVLGTARPDTTEQAYGPLRRQKLVSASVSPYAPRREPVTAEASSAQEAHRAPSWNEKRAVYDFHRVFSGTSVEGKESMRQVGMRIDAKTAGATAAVASASATMVGNAAQHNYVTGNRDIAASYAQTRDHGTPAIARMLVPTKGALGLERDPESAPEHEAYRTRQDIPPALVMKSGRDDTYTRQQLHAFRRTFDLAHGATVTHAQAADYMNEVKSDSEDDEPFLAAAEPMAVTKKKR